MPDIDQKVVEEKLAKGETLTPEETKFVMSVPPPGFEKVRQENDGFFDGVVDVDKDKAEKEKAAAEAKKKEDEAAKKAPEDAKSKEKSKETPAPEAKEKQPPEPPPAEGAIERLERELEKPEGQEDLKGFSDKEKAYFWQMRRDRRARQKAEEERDIIRLDRAKEKALADEAAKKAKEAPVIEDPLKDREDEDFITVKDAKKLLETAAKQTPSAPAGPSFDPIAAGYLKMCDKEAATKFADYAEVIACVDEIVNVNPAYQKKVAESIRRGDNPAIEMYYIIKGDPEFLKVLEKAKAQGKVPMEKKEELSADEKRKVEEAKRNQEALEKNTNREKTSGHAGGAESAAGEISLEQLLKMSDKEFAKIPKAKRDALLKQLGV